MSLNPFEHDFKKLPINEDCKLCPYRMSAEFLFLDTQQQAEVIAFMNFLLSNKPKQTFPKEDIINAFKDKGVQNDQRTND